MNDHLNRQIGQYRLIRSLGQGAFAEVFLGQHIHLNTLAAVKILHAKLPHYDIESFRSEARTIAHLIHPHIIRVLDFGVENEVPFLIMDYAPNGTIRQRYPRGAVLPLPEIINYLNQVASALQYAHNERLVHRDVKPENLLIGRQKELLLSDFGIALTFQGTFSAGTVEIAGTASYMAPEQFDGHPRPASDQYALGVIVYEWLSGTRPFEGTLSQLVWKHIKEEPPPLRERVSSIPPAIEHVVMTALAKDYHARYPSVADFAAAFTEACRSPHSYPVSTPDLPTVAPGYPLPVSVEDGIQTRTSDIRQINQIDTSAEFPKSREAQPMLQAEPHTSNPVHKRGLSRRQFVGLGLTGAVVALVGGGVSWYILNNSHQTVPTSGHDTHADTRTGATILTYTQHSTPVYAAAWSPDGKAIASASLDKTVRVWNATTGNTTRIYTNQGASENTVAWSPNGQLLASGSSDTTVDIWNPLTGQTLKHFTQHQGAIRTVAWSPDSKLIASGGDDTTIHVWEALTGKVITVYRHHTDQIWSVAWSPDGQYIVSASVDKTTHIWNSTEPQAAPLFVNHDHTQEVKAVAWSHNGQYIASASNDQTVRVWEAMTEQHATLFVYRGHKEVLNAVAWSNDDRYVASGSGDFTVHILDAQTGKATFKYTKHALAIHSVQWSRDDRFIVSSSDDKTVQIWRTRDA